MVESDLQVGCSWSFCMFSLCLCGIAPAALVFAYIPKHATGILHTDECCVENLICVSVMNVIVHDVMKLCIH